MRVLPAVILCILLASVSGCGDCYSSGVKTDCLLDGDVEGQSSDGTTYSNRQPGLAASCPTASFGGRSFGGGVAAGSSPQDLNVGLMFDTRVDTNPPSADSLTLKLTVRSVPLGPSEIDLDDTRATISGWSGLQGHISVTALSVDCSHGEFYCLLDLHATLAVSATSLDGRTLSLTGTTLDVHDSYWREKVMCTGVIGE
jgi:hypothetical protein